MISQEIINCMGRGFNPKSPAVDMLTTPPHIFSREDAIHMTQANDE